MKLSYVAPIKSLNKFQERLDRIHWQAFRKSLFKILTYLTTFLMGYKISILDVSQLFSPADLRFSLDSVLSNMAITADATMHGLVTLFSLLLVICLTLQASALSTKDFAKSLALTIGGTCLIYILYLTCSGWIGWILDSIGFIFAI